MLIVVCCSLSKTSLIYSSLIIRCYYCTTSWYNLKMSKRNFFLIFGFLIFLLLLFLISRNYTLFIIQIIEKNPFVGPLLLVIWRVVGIIFPAIPAGVVSFAAVPIFGWLKTYLYTLTGIMIGTSISFFLARKFREPLVKRFVPLKRIHEIEDKLTKRQEFLAIIGIRLFTVPVMDFSSYAAGLSKISFPKFFLATLIASIPDIAIFYFGEQ